MFIYASMYEYEYHNIITVSKNPLLETSLISIDVLKYIYK